MSSEPVGPCEGSEHRGVLVLVVGPSGAGKDTLIDGARERLKDNPRLSIAKRVVTRPQSVHEAHDSMTPGQFETAAAAGAFCLSWSAHGLSYGLPADLLRRVESGEVVVANVSRKVVAAAHSKFGTVRLIYVTAPPDVLAARLAARGREQGSMTSRVSPLAQDDAKVAADLVIDNVGTPDEGIARLVAFLAGLLHRDSIDAV